MIWSTAYTKLAIGVVAIGLFALGLSEYTAHVRADAEAQATIAAQATYQKQLTSQMADLQKALSEREVAYNAQFAKLNTQFQRASTPQDMAQLATLLMGLKTPVTITTPSPTTENPNPQPVAQVSLNDFPQAKAYLQECEQCKLNLTKTQADLADRQAQMALAQKQIDSLKLERDAAVKAEKGGSWLRRTGRALKYIGIGAAIGGAAICGSGHCR